MFYQFCEQDWWYDYSRYSPECTYTKALLYNSMEGELFLAPGQQQPAARSRLAQIYQHWQFHIFSFSIERHSRYFIKIIVYHKK